MLLALTFGSLFAFLIFVAILGLVAWGVTRIPMPEWMRVMVWVVVGIFFLLMIYDLVTGGHTVPQMR